MSFWKELSRRNVVKVGIAYAVAAWLIIHPVDIIFPILHLPEWSITLVAAFLIICFPFVLIFSWVYEVTPKGLKRTKDVPLSKSTTQLTGRKLNYIIIGLLVLAVALLIFDNFYLDRRAAEIKQAPAISDMEKAKKTIAVLPFENLSSDPEQVYFVDGLSEEILNSLCQISDLNVIARTSSFSFKGANKTVQEIAGVLGVDNILEGSVRKAGNELRITAQLIRAADSVHLWSKTYDKKLKDIFTVQEEIATAVASELKATLGVGKSFKQLGGTDNVEAYELYLVAKGQMWDGSDLKAISLAIKGINEAIALDHKFALAWSLKASAHIFLSIFGPTNSAVTEQSAALNAALKSIELEPNLAAGYYALGDAHMSLGDWINAEMAYRKAIELTIGSVSEYKTQIAIHYILLGNFEKSYEILKERRRNDPMNKDVRANYIFVLGFRGDMQQAEEEYKRCKALFSEQWPNGDGTISFLRLSSGDIVFRDKIVYSYPMWDTLKVYLESPEEGLRILHRFIKDDNNLSSSDLQDISLYSAYFGDPEFAMDALEQAVNIQGSNMFCVWLPVFKEVRQLPRFKEYLKKIGLVDYWNKFGWPDMCHQLDNGDFECD